MSKSRPGVITISVCEETHERIVKGKDIVARNKLIKSKWPLITKITLGDVIKVAMDTFENESANTTIEDVIKAAMDAFEAKYSSKTSSEE